MNKLNVFLQKYENLLTAEAIKELSEIADEYNYLKEIFNNSDWTISLVDSSGKYLITNPKMNQLVGNVVGKEVGSLSKDNKIKKIIEELSNNYNKNQYSEIIETVLNNVRKSFYLQVTKINDKFLIMGSDITEVEDLKKQQEFNERMIMLGEMSSFIVHEINNPLNSISLASELISMLSQDKKIQHQTDQIMKMISVITNIISTLKSFSRKNNDDQTNLEINEICFQDIFNQAEIVLKPKTKRDGVKIFYEIDGSILVGNDTQFLQVLVNLISNSIDAIKENQEKWIKVIWKKGELSVIDSGNGIDEKTVPKLFEKFHTAKGSKGNGIGLYLSKEILNKYGYDLQYRTTSENNTSFVWVKKEAA